MLTVKYTTSVLVDAGWRSIDVVAEVELNETGKKGTVTKVLSLDGEDICRNMSRTGAKRQQYNGNFVASREIGNVKIISKCEILNTPL